MPNRVRILALTDADRVKLERRARDRGAQARVAERARIVLLAAEGLTGPQIAERVGCTEPTVIKWRRQYAEAGLAGLEDARERQGEPRLRPHPGEVSAGLPVCELQGEPRPRPHQVKWLLYPWVPVPGGVEVSYGFGLLGGPERLELG
jgi:transposase-like protein